jgi:predicted dehydrogenase
MTDELRWGIIGTGSIAHQFARGLAHSRTGRLVAVGSRRRETAEEFGDEFNVAHRHAGYDALLDDADVEAVYIATPHPFHAEWAVAAAEAGKHILCEKPLSINHAEAADIVEAARHNDVFLMEAFMYRCHPQTARLVGLLREGAIGDVGSIQATFSFRTGWNPDGRLLRKELGGGGILDVGCYCTSMARLIAGVARGEDFAEPLELKGCGHLGETGVDEWAVASLKFPGGILAELATGVRLTQQNVVRIYGTEGYIEVPSPWIPAREGGSVHLFLHKGGETHKIEIETGDWLYGIEADTVAAHLQNRQAAPPAMTWDDTLGNMKALDRWRAEIGLEYEADREA